jgi:hypothetical protein
MSFYAYVERLCLEFEDEFDVDSLSNQIDAMVSKRVLHEDVASDLESGSIISVVAEIASLAPKISFAVRGFGEDPRTVWVREYEDGQERFAFGPPEGGEF